MSSIPPHTPCSPPVSRAFGARTFLLGMLAGSGILLAGMLLGGASKVGPGAAEPDGAVRFDTLRARRFEVVDSQGDTVARLRAGKHGGVIQVFDNNNITRAEICSSGTITVFREDGHPLAAVGQAVANNPGGRIVVFDPEGSIAARLPGWVNGSDEPRTSLPITMGQ